MYVPSSVTTECVRQRIHILQCPLCFTGHGLSRRHCRALHVCIKAGPGRQRQSWSSLIQKKQSSKDERVTGWVSNALTTALCSHSLPSLLSNKSLPLEILLRCSFKKSSLPFWLPRGKMQGALTGSWVRENLHPLSCRASL